MLSYIFFLCKIVCKRNFEHFFLGLLHGAPARLKSTHRAPWD